MKKLEHPAHAPTTYAGRTAGGGYSRESLFKPNLGAKISKGRYSKSATPKRAKKK